MKTPTFMIALATAATLASTPALAAENASESKTIVRYDDLNLATLDGQAQLQARLDKAANKVCVFDGEGKLREARDYGACFRAARQTAAVRMAEVVSEDRRGG